MGKFIPVEPEKWAEMVKALALVKEMDKTINASQAECRRLKEKSECQAECLEAFDKKLREAEAEVERLRKACKLVFDESAKRKFLMCYRGDDFYVSLQAMEAMSEALGYRKAKEGKQP